MTPSNAWLPHDRQVERALRERVPTLRPDGRFMFAAVHSIQPSVPAENILAMWAALREANGA